MRDADNIREVDRLGPDWMGFIFYSGSSRFVSEVPEYLPEKSKRVGVFVNEELPVILEQVQQFQLDVIQLHGSEPSPLCHALRDNKLKVIKAFSIESDKPFPTEKVMQYEGCCDYFLFDTKTVLHGGSGRKYDWDILRDYRGETPFLLSGGISPDDAAAIKGFAHLNWVGIDLNSRFELSPGIKDASLLNDFFEKIK